MYLLKKFQREKFNIIFKKQFNPNINYLISVGYKQNTLLSKIQKLM